MKSNVRRIFEGYSDADWAEHVRLCNGLAEQARRDGNSGMAARWQYMADISLAKDAKTMDRYERYGDTPAAYYDREAELLRLRIGSGANG